MRNTIQNVGLLVIVLTLSAIFLLQFGGPQSQGCSQDNGAKYAAKVYGDTITLGEMKSAYILANGPRYGTQAARDMKLKELVLTGLIERDLLAREAQELGFRISEDDVMIKLAEEGVIYVSAPVGAPAALPAGAMPLSFADETGAFNKDNARRFIQNRLGRTIQEFAQSQIQETLAERMREVVGTSVAVSPGEVWDAYVREKEKVELKYVRFDDAFYRELVETTPADLATYRKEHAAEVDAEYEREKHRYTGLEKQVRARHILIKVAADATDAVKAAAKTKAEAARARAVKGEDFAKLALALSDDTGSAVQGGDLGYNTRGKMVAPFDDAQFALKPGDISDVVESRFGYHVIKVEGVREGDVPLDEAKDEIALAQLKNVRADALAKSAAEQTLAELKSGTNIEELDKRLGKEKEIGGDRALAPVVKDTRPFGRGASPIPGLEGNALVLAAFELTPESPLLAAPIKAGDSWVVARLTSREQAKREGFAGGADERRLHEALLRRKRGEVVDRYIVELRKKAEQGGSVRINPEAVAYSTSEEQASL
ncbi:MAG: Peptidyl-prolyl cis-trans isomerase SurA [Myxococcaceae bacterium]|nr:Peptidyl-prolyl cis-trans isomerase SurA [Myxococcaceae bacterium]